MYCIIKLRSFFTEGTADIGILWQLAYSLDFIRQANGDYMAAAVFLFSVNKRANVLTFTNLHGNWMMFFTKGSSTWQPANVFH